MRVFVLRPGCTDLTVTSTLSAVGWAERPGLTATSRCNLVYIQLQYTRNVEGGHV